MSRKYICLFISEPWTAAIWVISLFLLKLVVSRSKYMRGRRDCMVVGFTTTYAISTYHHSRWEFQSHSGDTTCDQVYQWPATSRWFSPGIPRYIWNIVESGIKHHKTNKKKQNIRMTLTHLVLLGWWKVQSISLWLTFRTCNFRLIRDWLLDVWFPLSVFFFS